MFFKTKSFKKMQMSLNENSYSPKLILLQVDNYEIIVKNFHISHNFT